MPSFVLNGAADTDLTTKPKRLANWHMKATSAAVVLLRNGSASGDIVVPIRIPTDASASMAYSMPDGLLFPGGLFVDWVSGAIVGSVTLE
jgi:hypothetical protein